MKMMDLIKFLFGMLCLFRVSETNYHGNYYCKDGKDVMVHLFEWKWEDIANECENYLSKNGYCGVQISPPNEHRIIIGGDGYKDYPWYQRYQPVSYKLVSRSGNEEQFRDMVRRCNNVGVYIYADAVINHMTAGGIGVGSGQSNWNGDNQDYPGVPFSDWDFHGRDVCHTSDLNIHDYNNPQEVRFCRLLGLRDLKHSKDYVQEKIAEYMNNLISIGVAGFRIDASKHMEVSRIGEILGRLRTLNTEWFPAGTKAFVFQEVIDMGSEPIKAEHYFPNGRVTEFKHCKELGDVIRKNRGQKLSYLRNWGQEWGMMPGLSAVIFTDNHDNQRGHGAGGFGSILTFFEDRQYKIANSFMLAWPYGYIKVMSSYRWNRRIVEGKDENDWVGPPSSPPGVTKPVQCFGEWVCEHRWRQISNMVKFHNVAVGTPVENWWSNNDDVIAFSRGNKAFITINNENFAVEETFQTGLPAGDYCDVISSENNRPPCSGKPITVNGDGTARIRIENDSDPVVAIHV